jgi:hypothetical protein
VKPIEIKCWLDSYRQESTDRYSPIRRTATFRTRDTSFDVSIDEAQADTIIALFDNPRVDLIITIKEDK